MILTYSGLARLIESELQNLGIEKCECRAESELIIRHCSGLSLAARMKDPGQKVANSVMECVNSLLARRKKREPLQYCLGETYFYGLPFQVCRGVLIPRPDSEILVEAALSGFSRMPPPLRLCEIGTGSGIISVILLKKLSEAKMSACDISETAVSLTEYNARAHGVLSRLAVSCADWHDWLARQTEPLSGLVANPPYISYGQKANLAPEVSLWEPEQALFGGGEDGLDFYRDLSVYTGLSLAPGAPVILEIGAGQSGAVTEIFSGHGWTVTATHADLSGTVRVLSLVRKHAPSGALENC